MMKRICAVALLGAFAMGRRGHTYREILAHYYTGAKLGRLSG